MKRHKKIVLALVAVLILVGGTAFTAAPINASGCKAYHTVRRGEYLSWLGRYYGVNWWYIAQANGIPGPRYVIYPGQVLCIPSGSYYGSYYSPSYSPYYPTYPNYYPSGYSYQPARSWNFSIVNVTQDTNVVVQIDNMPANVKFKVKIGRNGPGGYTWIDLPDMDTGAGGSAQATIPIPAEFKGAAQLILRMEQTDSSGASFSQEEWFNNVTGDRGIKSYNTSQFTNTYYPYNYYYPNYWPGYNYYPPPPKPGATHPPIVEPEPWPGP